MNRECEYTSSIRASWILLQICNNVAAWSFSNLKRGFIKFCPTFVVFTWPFHCFCKWKMDFSSQTQSYKITNHIYCIQTKESDTFFFNKVNFSRFLISHHVHTAQTLYAVLTGCVLVSLNFDVFLPKVANLRCHRGRLYSLLVNDHMWAILSLKEGGTIHKFKAKRHKN